MDKIEELKIEIPQRKTKFFRANKIFRSRKNDEEES